MVNLEELEAAYDAARVAALKEITRGAPAAYYNAYVAANDAYYAAEAYFDELNKTGEETND